MLRSNIIASLLLWILITAAAWPAFVAANFAISWFFGEGSIIDAWIQEPKRNTIDDFITGYTSSLIIAALIGLVAVVDFQLLARHKLTGYIAGILIPVSCIAIAFIYFPEPGHLLPGFALSGFALWILYKLVDIGYRLRRVS